MAHMLKYPTNEKKANYAIILDSREHKLIELIKKDHEDIYFPNMYIAWHQLSLGDIIIAKIKPDGSLEHKYIIERKDISDLISTIKDPDREHNLAEMRQAAIFSNICPMLLIEDANRIFQNVQSTSAGKPKITKSHYKSMMSIESIWHFINGQSQKMPTILTLKPAHTLHYLTAFLQIKTHKSGTIKFMPRMIQKFQLDRNTTPPKIIPSPENNISGSSQQWGYLPIGSVQKKRQKLELLGPQPIEGRIIDIWQGAHMILLHYLIDTPCIAIRFTTTIDEMAIPKHTLEHTRPAGPYNTIVNMLYANKGYIIIPDIANIHMDQLREWLMLCVLNNDFGINWRYEHLMQIINQKTGKSCIICPAPIVDVQCPQICLMSAPSQELSRLSQSNIPWENYRIYCAMAGLLCMHYLKINNVPSHTIGAPIPLMQETSDLSLIDLYFRGAHDLALEAITRHIADKQKKESIIIGITEILEQESRYIIQS